MTLQIQQIIKHLFQANSLEEVSRERLEELVRQYPAFNVGRYLLSKKLQAEQADHFPEETRKTNLYFTNPYWLQWLLDSTEDGPVTLSRDSWRAETPAQQEAEEPQAALKAAAGQGEPAAEAALHETSLQEPVPESLRESVQEEASAPLYRPNDWQRVQMEESLGLEEPPAAPAPWEEPAPASPEEPKTTPWEESVSAELEESKAAAWEEPAGEETEAPPIPEAALIAETGGTVEPKQEDTRFIEAIEEEMEEEVPDNDPAKDGAGTGLLENPVFAYRQPGGEALPELPAQPETQEQALLHREESSASESETVHQPEEAAVRHPDEAAVHHPEEIISPEETRQTTESLPTAAEEPEAETHPRPDQEPLLAAEAAPSIGSENAGPEKIQAAETPEMQPETQQAGNPETQAGNKEAPVESQDAPVKSEDTPVVSQETPAAGAESKSTPAESREPALVIDPYHTIDYFASQGIRFVQEENPKDKLGQQMKSFTEWLRVMKRLPQKQESPTPDPATEHRILAFAAHSNETREVVTETMAEVLAMQGMSEKAAEVYRKLSLLNPAKSAYFAAKIEQLKVK